MAEYYVWIVGNVQGIPQKLRVKLQTTDAGTAKQLALEQVKPQLDEGTEGKVVDVERTA